MKNLLPLLVLILVVSCGKPGGESGCQNMACEVASYSLATTEEGNIPPEALLFSTLVKVTNFDSLEKVKVENAADLVKRIIMSQEFKDEVVNHIYNGNKTFVDNSGLTNLQIYDRIIIAAERLSPDKNFRLDVELELYYEDSSTIGYTYPSTPRIWMNRKFFTRYTPYQVAGNLTHEWLHKLGFTHAVSDTDSRAFSVPYAVGYIVRRLAAEMYPGLY